LNFITAQRRCAPEGAVDIGGKGKIILAGNRLEPGLYFRNLPASGAKQQPLNWRYVNVAAAIHEQINAVHLCRMLAQFGDEVTEGTRAMLNLIIPRSLLRAPSNGESKGGEHPLWSRAGLTPRTRNAPFIRLALLWH